jgi:HK97 family phage portal protein
MKFRPVQFIRATLAGMKSAVPAALSTVPTGTSWWAIVRESFTGAWQRNVEVAAANVLSYWAVYACIRLIAGDIAKMRLKLVAKGSNGVWTEIEDGSPYLVLLRKPNRYQTRVQFWTYWICSLLIHGNTYALKERDDRGMVKALYILDPTRVSVLVGEDGSVFYQLKRDDLSGVGFGLDVVVPASEIIHDRLVCLHHPLVGVSPIFASGIAATQGLAIQNNSANFFQNGSMPGGIIKVPAALSPAKAAELKAAWESGYSGDNRGKTAILADKMEYQALTISAADAQLIEQLKMTAEMVCSTFGVPPYKIGIGTAPVTSVAAQDQNYYSQCLQPIIEGTEAVLDEGLGMADANGRQPFTMGVEFDLKALIRMDPAAQIDYFDKAIKGAVKTPNEARKDLDLQPMEGGDALYLQQQNYSLAALAKRDAQEDPFGTAKPEPAPMPEPIDPTAVAEEAAKASAEAVTRALGDITARVNSIAAAVAEPPSDLLDAVEVRSFMDELEQAFPDG